MVVSGDKGLLGEERARTGAYVWRSLIDSGAIICNGTDVPVGAISPVASYFAPGMGA